MPDDIFNLVSGTNTQRLEPLVVPSNPWCPHTSDTSSFGGLPGFSTQMVRPCKGTLGKFLSCR